MCYKLKKRFRLRKLDTVNTRSCWAVANKTRNGSDPVSKPDPKRPLLKKTQWSAVPPAAQECNQLYRYTSFTLTYFSNIQNNNRSSERFQMLRFKDWKFQTTDKYFTMSSYNLLFSCFNSKVIFHTVESKFWLRRGWSLRLELCALRDVTLGFDFPRLPEEQQMRKKKKTTISVALTPLYARPSGQLEMLTCVVLYSGNTWWLRVMSTSQWEKLPSGAACHVVCMNSHAACFLPNNQINTRSTTLGISPFDCFFFSFMSHDEITAAWWHSGWRCCLTASGSLGCCPCLSPILCICMG